MGRGLLKRYNVIADMINSIIHKIQKLLPSNNSGYAFLFDADLPEFNGYYGGPCEDVLLESLFRNDLKNTCYSLILRGDLIIYRRAEKYLGVSRKKEFGDRPSVSWTVGVDPEAYSTMFWDLMDSISLTWHSTEDKSLPFSVLKKNTYVIYFPTISRNLVSKIDQDLKGFPAYHGVFELDRGNPLHIALFDEQLVDDSFIKDGAIYTQKDSGDIPLNLIYADNEEIKKKVIYLYEEDFYTSKPQLPKRKKLSKRGRETLELIENTKQESHYQNLAISLRDMASEDSSGAEFAFSIPKGFESVIIPKEKLVDYALNINHPNGAHKATLFREILGIRSEHWKYLNNQIIESLPKARLHKTRITEYGIQYHALLPVTGLNGNNAYILTAWFVDETGYARLTTLYVASKKDQEKYK